MANFILTCVLAAFVACGIISVFMNFVGTKLNKVWKTIVSIIMEILVAAVIFTANSIFTGGKVCYTVITVIAGVLITVGTSQIFYNIIVKLMKEIVTKIKASITSK